LGEKSSTIDLDLASLEAPQSKSVEELANGIVFDNRQVLTRFVGPEGLADLELRKAPAVNRNIRIVEIEDLIARLVEARTAPRPVRLALSRYASGSEEVRRPV